MARLLHPKCPFKHQHVPRVLHRTLQMLSGAPLAHQSLLPRDCKSASFSAKRGEHFGFAAVPQAVAPNLCSYATRTPADWESSRRLIGGVQLEGFSNRLHYVRSVDKSRGRAFQHSSSSCLGPARSTTARSDVEDFEVADSEVADRIRHEVDVRDTVPLQEVAGNVVCLGKFDALHLGHRALAERGAAIGPVFMLSFSNMAEVLGWEPRLPLLASCHRPAVLRQWASVCGGIAPKEVLLDFQDVRRLSPEAFVDLLADQLKVKGVVAGDNYRFGFKAAGDAAALQSLGKARGLEVAIVGSVTDCGPHCAPSRSEHADRMISSTRVRRALAQGDLECVEQLLGRRHQLAVWTAQGAFPEHASQEWVLPRSCLLNEPPCAGAYEALASILPMEADTNCDRDQNETEKGMRDSLNEEPVAVEVHIQPEKFVVLLRQENGDQKARDFRTLSGPHAFLNLDFLKAKS